MRLITDLPWEEMSKFLMKFQEFAEKSGLNIYNSHGKLRDPESLIANIIAEIYNDDTPDDEYTPNACENDGHVEMVNHPAHYNQGKRECIAEMELLFGPEDVAGFCKCSAYKYRTRAGIKPGNSRDQDLAKADWYIDYLDDMIKRYTTQSEPAKIGFASNKNMEAVA